MLKATPGTFVRDSNFFVNGIGVVNEALKGYYILTYTPPAHTFKTDPKNRIDLRNDYRRIGIKVKRPGVRYTSGMDFSEWPNRKKHQPEIQARCKRQSSLLFNIAT
jgi:hypothetical protein